VISENSRKADLCARIGGEEFAIIMPETELKEAANLAERLRIIIENMYGDHQDMMKKPITVSIGVATFPEHGNSAKALYKAADDALYKAKQTGRNRVVAYPDIPVTLTDATISAS
jgi:diguanylate cyclase (GGDEF)-like protein